MRIAKTSVLLLLTVLSFNRPQAQETIEFLKNQGQIKSHKIKSVLGFTKFKVIYIGNIKLSKDKSTIVDISDNGYVIFEKNGLFRKQRITFSKKAGELLKEYHVNGRKESFLMNGNAILQELIEKTINYIPFAVNSQLDNEYNQSGIHAVFKLIDNIRNEDLKVDYLIALAKKEYAKNYRGLVFNFISNRMSSDLYKAKILNALIKLKFSDDQFANYFSPVYTMESDFRKCEMLLAVLNNCPLVSNHTEHFLKAVKGMSNDYYKSKFHIAFAGQNISDNNLDEVIFSIRGIKSDYYKSKSLIAFAPLVRKSDNYYQNLYLNACGDISSSIFYNKTLLAIR